MTDIDKRAWTCINRWERRGYVEQTAIFKDIMSELVWLRKRVAELEAGDILDKDLRTYNGY